MGNEGEKIKDGNIQERKEDQFDILKGNFKLKNMKEELRKRKKNGEEKRREKIQKEEEHKTCWIIHIFFNQMERKPCYIPTL